LIEVLSCQVASVRPSLTAGSFCPAPEALHLPCTSLTPRYYVSRPFYKSVDRVLEETLRAAEILFTLTAPQCASGSLDPLHRHLVHARRNLAVFQHHDGITGTAKDHVVIDYGERMHSSLKGLQVLRFASELFTPLALNGRRCMQKLELVRNVEPVTTFRGFDILF
jgi:hypothetical protein